MKKQDIVIGGHYTAKVSGKLTTVRVDDIRTTYGYRNRERTLYDCTNLTTGMRCTFKSAAKFRERVETVTKTNNPRAGKKLGRDEDDQPGSVEQDILDGYRCKHGVCIPEPCTRCHGGKATQLGPAEVEQRPDPPSTSRSRTPTGRTPTRSMGSTTPSSGDDAGYAIEIGECPPAPDEEETPHDIDTDTEAPTSPHTTTLPEEDTHLPSEPENAVQSATGASTVKSGGVPDARAVEKVDCPDCDGYGRLRRNGFPCPRCKTSGKVAAEPAATLTTNGEPVKERKPSALGRRLAAQLEREKAGDSRTTAAPRPAGSSTRQRGTPVAGMVPNDEQEGILDVAATEGLKVLVVGAGAGTGKTATLKMLEQVLTGRGQYTAFNTSLVAESKAKFVRAACNTTHSLAFRAVGRRYSHRLGGERRRSSHIARILGMENMTVSLKGQGPPDQEGKPTDRPKTLHADFLAGQVLEAVRRFCQSSDLLIGRAHLQYIDGIDAPASDGKRGYENNDRVKDYLVPFLRKAWDDLRNVNGELPFSHDCYVKLWQLGEGDERPVIAADYILLDEAQDTAPVFLDVLKQQSHALLVLVGDDNQQIYEWRGAVNAMASFAGAPRRLLSQSYRFGQAVADVANTVLATLEAPTDLVMRGNPDVPSRVVSTGDGLSSPRCFLYRTNAGAVSRVMRCIEEGKKPHLIGGGAETVKWCQAAIDLRAGRGTRHPELACFDTWAEVVEYSSTDEGGDLKLMVKLVEEFGAEEIRDALKDMPGEDDADVVISTAHKSKGREWDTVRLGPDFPTANRMSDADRRLLYVAATRAKLTLDVAECPPFCGGNEKVGCMDGEETRWVPGLRIRYTKPQPTAEQQAAWLADKVAAPSPPPSDVAPAESVSPTPPPPPTHSNGKFTYARHGDVWCVRGPRGAAVGSRVSVERRDGSVSTLTLRGVVKEYPDATIYGV